MDRNVIDFEAHVENLKLDLDVNPTVLEGIEAEIFIKSFKYKMADNGGYDPKTNTVAVKDPENIGTLAHEMRHAWQFKNKDQYCFNFLKNTTNVIHYMVSRKE
ncbi:MAG: hypothetical protein K0S34_415 [Bacillales bacterium]|nr:hypothetical protein [Bacillales bacterium]